MILKGLVTPQGTSANRGEVCPKLPPEITAEVTEVTERLQGQTL